MKTKLLYIFFFLINICWAIDQNPQNQEFDTLFEQLKRFREQDKEKQMLESGKKAILIAEALKDYSAKAKVYIAIGNYYNDKNESSVSAYGYYYKAFRAYSQKKDSLKMVKTLLRLAILEKNTKNYLKSKESSFLAITLLNNKPSENLESIYNNLGIVFGELNDLKKSYYYHEKALQLRLKSGDQELVLQSYNNIATAYLENGEIIKAKPFYNKGLSLPINTLEQFPQEYARILDNYTYLQFLQGEKEVLPNFLKALSLREKCGDNVGVLSSYLRLSIYYQKMNQFSSSNSYAYKTYQKALQTKNYRDVLTALEILEANSNSVKDYKKALDYANKHKQIVDILDKEELKINEKFAEIRYESNQKELENKVLKVKNKEQQLETEKRKKYLSLTIAILGLVLFASLGYFYYSKWEQKKKELKATQKIISLLLEKKEAVESAKNEEQKRIAGDLHDSISGKLSGLKLKLDTIGITSPEEIKVKIDPTVDQLEDILEELHDIVHNMNDQKLINISYPLLIEGLSNQQFLDKTIISSYIDSTIDWEKISNQIKLEIYYIVQEGIRNINQHSQALEGSVELNFRHPNLLLTIKDNGIGLKKDITFGMGIAGIRKRAQEVGGLFEIQSKENDGTTIIIKIPIS